MPTTGALGLFLAAEPVNVLASGLELTLQGSVASGHFAGCDLYTLAASGDNLASGSFPLWLEAPSVGLETGGMNLWTEGRRHSAGQSLDLYLGNSASGTSTSLTLMTLGSGATEGATPCGASLGLYICRDTAEGLPLFLLAPGVVSSGVTTLYVRGAPVAASGLDLTIPEVVGAASQPCFLFAHGY